MRSERLLFALLLSALTGCADHCLRNSDCAAGQGCIEGLCQVRPELASPLLDLTAPPDLATPGNLSPRDLSSD